MRTRGRARDDARRRTTTRRNDSRNGPNAPRTVFRRSTRSEKEERPNDAEEERPNNSETRNVRTIRRPRIVRDTREEFLPRGFGAGDVRRRDAAARGRRGGARRARSDASKGDERDARRVPARVRRTRTFRGDVAESRSARGGSSPETPEDAAARLDELARASEAALARTRRRARAFLATRVEAVFGRDEEGDPAPAVVTGWSEDEPS